MLSRKIPPRGAPGLVGALSSTPSLCIFFFRVARPQPHHALVSYAFDQASRQEVRHAETCLFAHFPSVTFAGAGQGDAPFVSDSRREHEKR